MAQNTTDAIVLRNLSKFDILTVNNDPYQRT
jgi:hypothetical protein